MSTCPLDATPERLLGACAAFTESVPDGCRRWVLTNLLMWQWSQSLEQAARNLITKYNVTVIVASGNSEEDSCYIAPGIILLPPS